MNSYKYKASTIDGVRHVHVQSRSGQWLLIASAPSDEFNSMIEKYIKEGSSFLDHDDIAQLRALKTKEH